jgi:hypothetical protein
MKIDFLEFRNALVEEQDKHLYAARILTDKNGNVPFANKVIYSCEISQANTYATIVRCLDQSKVS